MSQSESDATIPMPSIAKGKAALLRIREVTQRTAVFISLVTEASHPHDG